MPYPETRAGLVNLDHWRGINTSNHRGAAQGITRGQPEGLLLV